MSSGYAETSIGAPACSPFSGCFTRELRLHAEEQRQFAVASLYRRIYQATVKAVLEMTENVSAAYVSDEEANYRTGRAQFNKDPGRVPPRAAGGEATVLIPTPLHLFWNDMVTGLVLTPKLLQRKNGIKLAPSKAECGEDGYYPAPDLSIAEDGGYPGEAPPIDVEIGKGQVGTSTSDSNLHPTLRTDSGGIETKSATVVHGVSNALQG